MLKALIKSLENKPLNPEPWTLEPFLVMKIVVCVKQVLRSRTCGSMRNRDIDPRGRRLDPEPLLRVCSGSRRAAQGGQPGHRDRRRQHGAAPGPVRPHALPGARRDRAILVSDRKFAGADTWATALTLAAVIRKAEPDTDLILVGKQAIDGDTAQVGPEIAEILGMPQIMYG